MNTDANKVVLNGRFNAKRIDRSTRARHLYTTHRLRAEETTNKMQVLQRTVWLWGEVDRAS